MHRTRDGDVKSTIRGTRFAPSLLSAIASASKVLSPPIDSSSPKLRTIDVLLILETSNVLSES